MTDVTNSETEAEARERLAKAVESFDGTDKEARELSDQVLLAMGWRLSQHAKAKRWWINTKTEIRHQYDVHPIRNAQDALDLFKDTHWEVFHISVYWQLVEDDRLVEELWLCEAKQREGMGQTAGDAKFIQAAITAAALRAGG